MEQTIYYCYKKTNGEFMGSGTPHFDNDEIGCTTEPSPIYEENVNFPYWENNTWILKPIENSVE